jgi:DNA-binding transcriptional ArsR family regulator
MGGPAVHTFTELRIGPPSAVPASVVPHPGATLLSLVADALGGRPQGVPPRWRRAVRAAAPAGAEQVIRPLFAPEYSVIPDCLTPSATLPGAALGGQFERLADLEPDVLLAELADEFDGQPPAQWRPVVEDPRAWLVGYAAVLRGVWDAFAPVWHRAGQLVERETERVGVAVVGDGLGTVLAGLNARYRFSGTSLYLPDPQPEVFDLAGRRIVLVPMASGSGASVFGFDRPGFVWLGYPVPGLSLLWDDRPPPDPATDPLTLVLGVARATILRQAGRRPTMSEVATGLGGSAATATYHCQQLELAGLLIRERQGRQVRLRLTPRGESLLDLLI